MLSTSGRVCKYELGNSFQNSIDITGNDFDVIRVILVTFSIQAACWLLLSAVKLLSLDGKYIEMF